MAQLVAREVWDFDAAGSNPVTPTTQMSSPRQKEICLGLDYFLVYFPLCSNNDTRIISISRSKTAKTRNLPLNLNPVIRIHQHLVNQQIN